MNSYRLWSGTVHRVACAWLAQVSWVCLVVLACAGMANSQTATVDDGKSSAATDSPFEDLVFYCTECMTEVPENRGAGSSCPHCGAFFQSATNADGSESQATTSSQNVSLRIWCGIALVLLFAVDYFLRRRKAPATSS